MRMASSCKTMEFMILIAAFTQIRPLTTCVVNIVVNLFYGLATSLNLLSGPKTFVC